MVWIAWGLSYAMLALQVLFFDGKLNLGSFWIMPSLTMLICLLYLAGVERFQGRRNQDTGGMEPSKGKFGRLDWKAKPGFAGFTLILLPLAIALVLGLPETTGGVELLAILFVAGMMFVGLSHYRASYRRHRRWGPVIVSGLGSLFHILAVICVFEREAFVQIPLYFQTNVPAFLQFSYITIATLFVGGAFSVAGSEWGKRLNRAE